ncbi:ABC transporter ATP-binding protein [Halomarina halobia]|uniref:Probable branched-chain amino acid transport ATP-binding protein LivG n=1 Tax=Halomarina halobia TaxID=3033386 RepID=A0ABD6AED0_9EURY|nr:ABC transporter ATP-binding protein [Halomarina sp. PSR21]
MGAPLLELDGVTKKFGELVAVDDVTWGIDRDGLTALIGPNGAGKTTLYNLITGRLAPTSGHIRFDGRDVTNESPADRAHRGIGRSFQVTNIFEGLTVRENIRAPVIARSEHRWNPLGRASAAGGVAEETERVLDLVGLEDIAELVCTELSYGDKRRVEIGIVLATDPHLVLLDEPTAGMNPTETERMVDLVRRLDGETDMSFFVTEHDIDIIFSIADRILVLDRGRVIADGTPEEIRRDERVQRAYLGGGV